jgi:colicin import membrane protein
VPAKPAKPSFFRRHSRATVLSVAFHVALIVALTVGVSFQREPRFPPPSDTVAIEATVVDEAFIQQEMARLEEQEQAEVRRQQQEEQRAREQAEAAQRELEEQQQQLEQARVERERRETEARAEQARLAELQQQREVEEARRQEAERQRIAEEQRLAEQRAAEERRRQEEERQRQEAERQRIAEEQRLAAQRAAEARQRAEAEAELQRAMAAEEERRRAEQAGLLDQYVRLIENRIQQNWIRPASAGQGLRCEVNVTQIPSGEVIDVRVGTCNGDEAVVRSIEAAVRRASPLPQPPIPSLFSRSLIVNFQPDE